MLYCNISVFKGTGNFSLLNCVKIQKKNMYLYLLIEERLGGGRGGGVKIFSDLLKNTSFAS